MGRTSHSQHRRGIGTLLLLLFAVMVQPRAHLLGQQTSQAAKRDLVAAGTAHPLERGHAHRVRALDRRIDRILAASDAQRGSWGIQVADLNSGKLLYDRNGERLFIPASNLKLFTTAAALEKLGAAHTFHTTVETDAAPDAQGRVPELYLVGRGDPNLGPRTFPYTWHDPRQPADTFLQELADQIKVHGVRQVTGTLIADDTYFVWEPFAPNWAADDLEWGYGAPVTALAFNDNLLTIDVRPGAAAGDAASATLSPVADYYLLNNRIQTSAAGTPKNYHLERLPGSMKLDLWGQIPVENGGDIDTVAIANPPLLLAELFRAALQARGISVAGPLEVRHLTPLEAASLPSPAPPPSPRNAGILPAHRITLADHVSPQLREAVKVINKESENLHAEMLLRTLDRAANGRGSLQGGIDALNMFAAQQLGILPGETYFSDGSGLSREDLVAPDAEVRLLFYMAHSQNFQAYFDSLPIAGVDGTLARRLFDTGVKGKIHAKTGTVEHVNTLSGYMDLPSGKRLAFSIMANNHPLSTQAGQATVDAIAVAIYKHFAKR